MILSKPRLQHYSFAHLFLREKAFSNPATTVDELSRENGSNYLKSLWLTTGLSTREPNEELIEPDGIKCSPFLIGENHRGVIVEFPKPLGPTEAFFAAIVIPVNAKRGDKCSCRYFTLELSSDGPEKTVLGEWNGSMHLNCGPGPPPDEGYFEETVISRVLGTNYDPWKHERLFVEWIFASGKILDEKNDSLKDDDVDLIWNLSKADKEPEFQNFLAQLKKRAGRPAEQVTAENQAFRRSLNETIKLKMEATGLDYEKAEMELTVADHDRAYEKALYQSSQSTNKEISSYYEDGSDEALGFDLREEPVKWSREIFGRDLLSGDQTIIRISRMYIIESFRKPLNVGFAMVLWGAIGSGAIVRLGSPWWTGVIFASMVCIVLFLYLSTSRIRQIMKGASLAGLSTESAGLNDNGFVQSLGRNTEWMTKLNKVIEVIWGVGVLALIPILCWFFGALIGIVVTICTLLIAFSFFLFTAKTNTGLFKMAVEREKVGRHSLIDKFKAKNDVG